jgi:hypothetical protein
VTPVTVTVTTDLFRCTSNMYMMYANRKKQIIIFSLVVVFCFSGPVLTDQFRALGFELQYVLYVQNVVRRIMYCTRTVSRF